MTWSNSSCHILISVTLLTGLKEDGVLRGLENDIAFWVHYDHIDFKCSHPILLAEARKSNLDNLQESNNNSIHIYMHIYKSIHCNTGDNKYLQISFRVTLCTDTCRAGTTAAQEASLGCFADTTPTVCSTDTDLKANILLPADRAVTHGGI